MLIKNAGLRRHLVRLMTVLVILVGASVASAQEEDRRIPGEREILGGQASFAPAQTSYTATDDLWTWRTNRNRINIQSNHISAGLTVIDTNQEPSRQFWNVGDQLSTQYEMDINVRYVPDMDSDSSGMIRKGDPVEVSGGAAGQLSWFIPDLGDEVIVGTLNWDARITGSGLCQGEHCLISYEMSGPLTRDKRGATCGTLSVAAHAELNTDQDVQGFKSVSGMDVETEVVEFWTAELELNVARDGTTCYIGETEKNVETRHERTGSVAFYYGEERAPYRLGEPDATRVMPGDNVMLLDYRNIPVNLVAVADREGNSLWNPESAPLRMLQDMQVELRHDPERGTVVIGGQVRGRFDQEQTGSVALIAEGTIGGRGVCEGPNCTIQMIRQFEILNTQSRTSCGTMTLGVTVDYVHGQEPQWTFGTDGFGSMTISDHSRCFLDSLEDIDDI
jgi:hypothetical protein